MFLILLPLIYSNVNSRTLSFEKIINSVEDTLYIVTDIGADNDFNDSIEDYWQHQIPVRPFKKVVILSDEKDTAQLRNRINNNAILFYGLIEENNLFWNFIPNSIRKRLKKSYQQLPPNLIFITVGVNPVTEGNSIVFSSKSNSGLNKIHEYLSDDFSYKIIINGKIYEKGFLNENYKTVDEILSLSLATEDLDFFFKTLEDVHPQLLAHMSPESYLEEKKMISDSVKVLSLSDKLTKSKFINLLNEAAAQFGDGHTKLWPTRLMIDETDTSKKMLPFYLEYKFGKVLIGNTVKDLQYLKGNEIISIGNTNIDEYMAPIFKKISGEKQQFKWKSFINNQRIYWASTNLIRGKPFSITIKDSKNDYRQLNISPINLDDYDNISEPEKESSRSYYKFFDNAETCYYQYNSFQNTESEKMFMDSLFASISNNQTKVLILDLRFNGGGDSDMGDYLLNYLTSKPYTMYSRVDIKLSEQLFEKGRYQDYKDLDGLTFTYKSEPTRPKDLGNRFTGKLIVLTSSYTFSSAADFASVIKDYKLGTIIGEETGGIRQSFGDILSFQTPNYHVRFGVSYKCFYAPVPKPDDEIQGTMPDINITNDILIKYPNSTDPVFDYVMDYIKRR